MMQSVCSHAGQSPDGCSGGAAGHPYHGPGRLGARLLVSLPSASSCIGLQHTMLGLLCHSCVVSLSYLAGIADLKRQKRTM